VRNGLTCGLKNFHFQEQGFVISFPEEGNERTKYLYYRVRYTDIKANQTYETCLAEIVDAHSFDSNYPYTVGFFKGSFDGKTDFGSSYLEIRIVSSIEDFWKFLNDLDI
jgi:hypothetical protein